MKGILSMKEKEQKELFASLVKGFEKLLLYGKLTFEEWEPIYNIFLNAKEKEYDKASLYKLALLLKNACIFSRTNFNKESEQHEEHVKKLEKYLKKDEK